MTLGVLNDLTICCFREQGLRVLSVVVLVIALFALLGATCGVSGKKVDPAPEKRSALSNTGSWCMLL